MIIRHFDAISVYHPDFLWDVWKGVRCDCKIVRFDFEIVLYDTEIVHYDPENTVTSYVRKRLMCPFQFALAIDKLHGCRKTQINSWKIHIGGTTRSRVNNQPVGSKRIVFYERSDPVIDYWTLSTAALLITEKRSKHHPIFESWLWTLWGLRKGDDSWSLEIDRCSEWAASPLIPERKIRVNAAAELVSTRDWSTCFCFLQISL
jgi:hypothetical protein